MVSTTFAACARKPGPALLASGVGFVMAAVAAGEAQAQAASGCGDLQGMLAQRQSIAGRLTANGKKQIDARVACTGFNQLISNGNTLLKWAQANKDWCQIPDSFIQSVKADHGKATAIRGKACSMVAKQAQAEKQAKSGGGSGLLGGGGLTGPTRLPQGAL